MVVDALGALASVAGSAVGARVEGGGLGAATGAGEVDGGGAGRTAAARHSPARQANDTISTQTSSPKQAAASTRRPPARARLSRVSADRTNVRPGGIRLSSVIKL